MQTPDEVDLWDKARDRILNEYVLRKHNDLINLGALLQQQIILFRCQVAINGMEPETDRQGVPTGAYRRIDLSAADVMGYQRTLTECSKEIGRLEKALGIDKVTREAGGAHTLESYIRTLKKAAHERGVHITSQVTEYQRVFKELSWKLRILYNGDSQDRAYHHITPKSVLDWTHGELQALEAREQEWAKTNGKLYVGKL